MADSRAAPIGRLLTTFYSRLGSIEYLVRLILSQKRISAVLTFKGWPENKALLDFSNYPAKVRINPDQAVGDIYVTIEERIMHDIMLGRTPAGLALGRRELLLRGSASKMAKFIPMFEFSSTLYREHLADIGYPGYRRSTGYAPLEETVMDQKEFKGDPIPLKKLTGFEQVVSKMLTSMSFGIGYLMGTLRYRVMQNLSLFDSLSAMSKGLEAATPKKFKEIPSGE